MAWRPKEALVTWLKGFNWRPASDHCHWQNTSCYIYIMFWNFGRGRWSTFKSNPDALTEQCQGSGDRCGEVHARDLCFSWWWQQGECHHPYTVYNGACVFKMWWLWYQGERWMVMNNIPLCLVCMIIHLTIWDMGLFRTISVFTASKKSCFVNLMGPRRWRVHKQPLLSHSAWCNIGYSSHLRRRSGVYPGDCRSFNIWEVIAKPAIVCVFLGCFFKTQNSFQRVGYRSWNEYAQYVSMIFVQRNIEII